jgi:hypothetical protein
MLHFTAMISAGVQGLRPGPQPLGRQGKIYPALVRTDAKQPRRAAFSKHMTFTFHRFAESPSHLLELSFRRMRGVEI